jgi:hypothetical protein
MTTIAKNNLIFVQYEIFARGGSGGNNGQIYIAPRSGGVDRFDLNTNNGLDVYQFNGLLVNNSNSRILLEGDPNASPTKILTRQEEKDTMIAILGFSKSRTDVKYYYAKGLGGDGEGTDFDDLWTVILGMGTNDNMRLVIEYGIANSTGNSAPSFCEDGVYYRWNQTSDILYVVFNTPTQGETLQSIATGQATQQDVEATFESIYNQGIWDYAWDTNTGNICVRFSQDQTGSSTFNFSTTLSDEINFGDDVTAYVQRLRQEYKRKWVVR